MQQAVSRQRHAGYLPGTRAPIESWLIGVPCPHPNGAMPMCLGVTGLWSSRMRSGNNFTRLRAAGHDSVVLLQRAASTRGRARTALRRVDVEAELDRRDTRLRDRLEAPLHQRAHRGSGEARV